MVSPTSASLDDVAIGPSAIEPLPQVVDSELETKVYTLYMGRNGSV